MHSLQKVAKSFARNTNYCSTCDSLVILLILAMHSCLFNKLELSLFNKLDLSEEKKCKINYQITVAFLQIKNNKTKKGILAN